MDKKTAEALLDGEVVARGTTRLGDVRWAVVARDRQTGAYRFVTAFWNKSNANRRLERWQDPDTTGHILPARLASAANLGV